MDAFRHTLDHAVFGYLHLIGPLGELWIVLPIAATLVVWCFVCGERRGALAIFLATVATLVLVVLMKLSGTLIGLPWNPNWKWISTLFPSGHMAMGTVVYGSIVLCVGRAIPRLRGMTLSLFVVLMLLLGIQRVVFDIHPILDVLGGVALGSLSLAALLRLWPCGRLHPSGLAGVAVAAALILNAFYGREVPSSQMIMHAAARIHAAVAAIKVGWAGY